MAEKSGTGPVLVQALVKSGSKHPGILHEEGMLVVRVREPAVEGAANAACIRAIARAYGVPPSAVELIAGHRGRRKRFAVHQVPRPGKEKQRPR